MTSCRLHRRSAGPVVAAGVVTVLLCLALRGYADAPPAKTDSPNKPTLSIQACRAIALQNQPSIAAAQATLKTSLDRVKAVQDLRAPPCWAASCPSVASKPAWA